MEIKINTEFIKISQAVKLANVVSSGSEAKSVISDGLVKLNGETVSQRGKKVYKGDVIEVLGVGEIRVVWGYSQ